MTKELYHVGIDVAKATLAVCHERVICPVSSRVKCPIKVSGYPAKEGCPDEKESATDGGDTDGAV
jgi:hypothetical protein